jgi:hypothetical protein
LNQKLNNMVTTIKPEEQARGKIHALPTITGWIIQDREALNQNASVGVTIRGLSLSNGPCDYLLPVGRKATGVIEAKKGCYKPGNRFQRAELRRFKRYSYEELVSRDKLNLDIYWLKDKSLEDVDFIPFPNAIAAEIVENLEAALEQFRSVAEELTV